MSWDDGNDDWDAPSNNNWDEPKANTAPVISDKWDGEDEDDEALLGDDWDDDGEKKAEEKKKAAVPGVKKLTKRQLAKKREEEERKLAEKRMTAQKNFDPEEAKREKARQKKAIESANQQMTMDLFGGDGYEAPSDGEFQNDQLDEDNTDMKVEMTAADLSKLKIKKEEPLEGVVLKTKEDYKKFAVKVAGLATKDGKGKDLVEFLKSLLTEATKSMKLDDCSDVKKQINVICNQKQKDEAGKKKKAGAKKAQLTMSRANDTFGGDDYGGYDDGMDDFL